MRRKKILGLIYKDLYMGRKQLLTSFCSSVLIAVFAIVILLSFRYGNLKLLEENSRSVLFNYSLFVAKYLPVMGFCLCANSIAEISVREEMTKWVSFRHTTPVSPFRFALAKYITMLSLGILSIGLSMGYLKMVDEIFDLPVNHRQFAVVLLVAVLAGFMSVTLQIFMIMFRSTDKAGIAMVVTLVVLAVIIRVIYVAVPAAFDFGPINSINDIEAIVWDNKWFILVVYILEYFVGFMVTAWLYKRREK